MQAGSIRESLEKLSQRSSGSTRDALQSLQTKLAALLGPSPGFAAPPADTVTLARVNGQVATLYGQVWQVDAEPTASQSEASASVEHDVSDAMKRWDNLKTTDLPALNRILRAAKLPEVQVDSDTHREESGMDEE